MVRRLYFPLVGLFWVVMNVLLWRSELGDPQDGGTPVPVETVFHRILTAPDDSSLVLFRGEERLGTVHWLPTVLEANPVVDPETEFAPEGRVGRVTGYEINLDGSAAVLPNSGRRLRFQLRLVFDAKKEWRTLSVRLVRRPDVWEASADAEAEELVLRGNSDSGEWRRVLSFDDLSDPRRLLRTLGGPFAALTAGSLFTGLPGASTTRELSLGIQWEATQDWMRIAHVRTRIYRLRAHLFQDREIEVILSRVGEILRVTLPGNVRLLNGGFAGFR